MECNGCQFIKFKNEKMKNDLEIGMIICKEFIKKMGIYIILKVLMILFWFRPN